MSDYYLSFLVVSGWMFDVRKFVQKQLASTLRFNLHEIITFPPELSAFDQDDWKLKHWGVENNSVKTTFTVETDDDGKSYVEIFFKNEKSCPIAAIELLASKYPKLDFEHKYLLYAEEGKAFVSNYSKGINTSTEESDPVAMLMDVFEPYIS